MRLRLVLAVFLLAVPTAAMSGIFIYPIRSTQITADPPRYRVVVGFFNRYEEPIYGVRAEPNRIDAIAPATRILEASGPSWMHIVMDGDGWPTWIADENWPVWSDSIEIVTAEPVTCVTLSYLIPPNGYPYKTLDECLTADQVTPTRQETWGRLKTLYR